MESLPPPVLFEAWSTGLLIRKPPGIASAGRAGRVSQESTALFPYVLSG